MRPVNIHSELVEVLTEFNQQLKKATSIMKESAETEVDNLLNAQLSELAYKVIRKHNV